MTDGELLLAKILGTFVGSMFGLRLLLDWPICFRHRRWKPTRLFYGFTGAHMSHYCPQCEGRKRPHLVVMERRAERETTEAEAAGND
jgi:hypothetical protein